MNAASAIFVIVSLVFLGIGFWVINKKPQPPVRRGGSAASRGQGAGARTQAQR